MALAHPGDCWPLDSKKEKAKPGSLHPIVGRIFATKAEAIYRFGFVADAKDIPKWLAKRRPLPKDFRAAVRAECGEVVEAKRGERYHADIIRRIGEDAVEGYTYSPNAQAQARRAQH